MSVPYSSQSAECVKWEIRTFAFRSRVITASSWIATYCATSANAPVLYAFWMDSLCFCTAVSSLAMDRSADSASAFVRSCVYGNRKGQSICWACIGRVLDDGLVSNREGNRSEQSPAKGPNSHRRVRGKTGGVSDLGKPRPAVPFFALAASWERTAKQIECSLEACEINTTLHPASLTVWNTALAVPGTPTIPVPSTLIKQTSSIVARPVMKLTCSLDVS